MTYWDRQVHPGSRREDFLGTSFMVFNEEKDAFPEAKSLEDFLTILDNL